ncbi:guanine nucleotide-binding protein alpha-2subunit [Striga asiatica]|uniref:Guanine nucleotide-binding protein alpha-2subunit n=1 Tax=Striga asiatica TaxID=4170 RepID=A0A5A7PSG6_STRAF|nr:guanine nucleotide-binding protein alpha-2subunit [Striga asiatica]
MSPEVAAAVEDDADYSFALEYLGPPVTRDLPRAVPINVDRIPVAAVVSPQPYSNTLPLPIVQPISATEIISKKPSKDLKLSSVVSPTSVIPFDMRNNEASEGSFSKELGLGTETSVSSSSINEKDAENCLNNDPFASSGELTRDLECCNRDGELTSRDISCEFTSGIESSGALDSSSVFSVDYLSSRVSSSKFGNANRETDWDARPSSVRRSSVMTYGDIETDDDENTTEEFTRSEPEFVQRVRKEPAVRIKKGACYRCLKGNRFTEKEVCMVCDAKYCNSCVLRAMGSMPEGRKCVTCIGYPIDESKRGYLGKCSRMLKRLLNDLEVRQIMKAERLCEVNQLPPEYICVNGRPLYPEELILLQSCSNPPKKLKPGNYWYDKVSGLWGKEGQKPSQIITPHLNVGAPIKPDASNGNTKVYINCREITKVELRMLKLAGVQCAGNPHFWVNDDGSYQEEGQKNTKGYIWGKAGTKLLCAVLSLPVPSKSSQPCGEQARILYKDAPFSEEDREHIKSVIQSHLYSYIGTILEARERFEEESCPSTTIAGHDEENPYSISPCLKSFCDWLLRIMASGTLEAIFPAASREYAPVVEELLRTSAFHATYKRRNELDALPSIASYFLEQAVEILKPDYRPSDLDILYAERVTSSNGLSCVDFSFPDSSYDNNIDSGNLRDSMLR